MSLLALDLGTTFIKGAILDLDTLRINHVRRQPFPPALPGLSPLFYEVDPQVIVQTVRTLIADLFALAPDCTGIIVCTQMHGLVLTAPDGRALSNCITWQDQRVLTPHRAGGTYFERLAAQVSPQEQLQLGNELQPSRPLCYLHWLAENGQLPAEPACPVGLADFVIANLCQTTPLMEATGAGAHCAFNLATQGWHHALIERLGLDGLQWPALRPFGEVVGEIRIGDRSLTCYTPVGDHQCAVVGALLADDELSLNISTGSQASTVTPIWQPGDYQTRPFFDGRSLNTVTGIPAGRALNQLLSLLTELAHSQGNTLDDPWPYIAEQAAGVTENDLSVSLSFFDSVGGKQGAITHLREQNMTVGHLFHAAFQNMAANYYAAAQRLSPDLPWRGLVFSGGLAQKIGVLRELIQQRFQLPYRLSPSSEDTFLGLLALGLVATGRVRSVAEATKTLGVRYNDAP
jgi:sugar (pentulose or hexulose) kinase